MVDMMKMAWVWTAVAVLASVYLLLHGLVLKKIKSKKLAPGPKGLPVLGHFHLLGKNPHRDLQNLAKQHGPIMYLRLGFVDNIIVSSPKAAQLFLKTHDLVFASRPPREASKYIVYEQKNLSFSRYGPYWRNVRKLCTLQLLSNLKINSFRDMRREEVCLLIESIKKAGKAARVPVDLSAKVASLSADMSCRMIFGKKYEDEEIDERGFKGVFREGMQVSAIPNLGDYFPFLGKLDLQGLTKRMKALGKVFDQFLERIIDEHEQEGNRGQAKDFVDTMLSIMKSGEIDFQFNREHVKAIMLDLLGASLDTSPAVIEWTMSELLKQPQIMKKVQQELESKVGLDRMVEESDLEGLKYLELVIKESLRLHPVVPLLLPHEAREDCLVEGFHIPKRAQIVINVWAIGRDPNVWIDPEEFIPERFEGSNIDYRGHDFELIPFGSGRRSCPGIQLGITVVRLVVAQLVHCFDWELPKGMLANELDMTEEFGIVASREKHLMAVPHYRLRI